MILTIVCTLWIFNLSFHPGLKFVSGAVREEHDVGNVSFAVIVHRIHV